MTPLFYLTKKCDQQSRKHLQSRDGRNYIALLSVPIVWWRKPCEGLDRHGTSPIGRCEGSPQPSEVSSLGKLSVFSQSPIGTLRTSFILVLEMFMPKSQDKRINILSDLKYMVLTIPLR